MNKVARGVQGEQMHKRAGNYETNFQPVILSSERYVYLCHKCIAKAKIWPEFLALGLLDVQTNHPLKELLPTKVCFQFWFFHPHTQCNSNPIYSPLHHLA